MRWHGLCIANYDIIALASVSLLSIVSMTVLSHLDCVSQVDMRVIPDLSVY